MTPDLHHLAAAYALDALEPDERREFEAHYPTCEICAAEVLDYRSTAVRLAGAVTVPPGPRVRQSVLDEIARTRQISPLVPERVVDLAQRRRRTTGYLLGSVAAALLLVVGVVTLRGPTDLLPADELAAILGAPDTVLDELAGQPTAGSDDRGVIRVAWSAERNEVVLVGSGLDDPGSDKVYALWMLAADGSPVASVLFDPDDEGRAAGLGQLPGRPGGWGVTIEPAGGSPQPTGEILYLTA